MKICDILWNYFFNHCIIVVCRFLWLKLFTESKLEVWKASNDEKHRNSTFYGRRRHICRIGRCILSCLQKSYFLSIWNWHMCLIGHRISSIGQRMLPRDRHMLGKFWKKLSLYPLMILAVTLILQVQMACRLKHEKDKMLKYTGVMNGGIV